eukprot:COSAG02_NODE_3724_length_6321_cov_1.932819_4_plen_90_part_00
MYHFLHLWLGTSFGRYVSVTDGFLEISALSPCCLNDETDAVSQVGGVAASVVGCCLLYFICRRVGLYNKGWNEADVDVKDLHHMPSLSP